MQYSRYASEIVDRIRFEAALAEYARARPPNPKRLGLACLLVYAGLLLTLSAAFAV
jgi:hypothetical protein